MPVFRVVGFGDGVVVRFVGCEDGICIESELGAVGESVVIGATVGMDDGLWSFDAVGGDDGALSTSVEDKDGLAVGDEPNSLDGVIVSAANVGFKDRLSVLRVVGVADDCVAEDGARLGVPFFVADGASEWPFSGAEK